VAELLAGNSSGMPAAIPKEQSAIVKRNPLGWPATVE
jgi:hypothetical protein